MFPLHILLDQFLAGSSVIRLGRHRNHHERNSFLKKVRQMPRYSHESSISSSVHQRSALKRQKHIILKRNTRMVSDCS
jgi:hypothetical protein